MRQLLVCLIAIFFTTGLRAQPHRFEDPRPIFYVYGPQKAVRIEKDGTQAPFGREVEVQHVPIPELYEDDFAKQSLCLAGSFIGTGNVKTYMFLISTSIGAESKGWFIIGVKNSVSLVKFTAMQYMENLAAFEFAREQFRSSELEQVVGIRMHPGRSLHTVEREELEKDLYAAIRYLDEKTLVAESEK